MVDYEDLLDKARKGAAKSEFEQYMPDLVKSVPELDATKLRLLGNCIANSSENAKYLSADESAISELLETDNPLGLSILFNGSVNNSDFSRSVLKNSTFLKKAEPNKQFKDFLGSIWEALDGDIDRDIKIQLVFKGFFELLMNDPDLETDPQITEPKNFKKLYELCQKMTMSHFSDSIDENDDFEEEEDDQFGIGIKVIGNISSHNEFSLENAAEIEENVFTWETIALLNNLTAKKVDMDAILPKFPNVIPLTIKLIEQEDPANDDEEELQDDEQENELERYEEDEFSEPDEQGLEDNTPFDVGLWGPLLRNLARDPKKAQEINQYNPAKLLKTLLSYPATNAVGNSLATGLIRSVYNHELVDMYTIEPVDENKLGFACAAANCLVDSTELPDEEVKWAVNRIVDTILNALQRDPREESWIRGTKALAILRITYPWIDVNKIRSEIEQNSNKPETEAVKQNLKALGL